MTARRHRKSLCLSAGSVPLWWNLSRTLSPQMHKAQRHKEILFGIAIVLALGLSPSVQAQVARPLEDPAIEQRMKHLTKELRCLVCQNETLADSQAPLAEDLRREI